MKIILEFESDETKLAELSYKGPQLALGIEEFGNHLRNKIKHGEHNEETHKVLEEIYKEFFDTFGDLINN